jgi:prepilin-type N-terminal cleavage/methylation domain-containing protein
MPNKKFSNKAYSLIEISIVITIITVLIVGAFNGMEMVRKAKLVNAQNLTEQSIVPKIPNLMTWYETSLARSFSENQRENNAKISVWNDINPNSEYTNNATQSTDANRPTYITNRFNDAIAGIFFDGNDFLNYNGTKLVNSGYSVFIVERRMAGNDLATMIGGATTAPNSNLILAYRSNTIITQAHYANDIDIAVPGYSSPITRIHSFFYNRSYGKKYWLNGGINPDGANASQTTGVLDYSNAWIGRYIGYFFYGDIAEIIFYNRSLKTEERVAVEDYLSKKYNVVIQ